MAAKERADELDDIAKKMRKIATEKLNGDLGSLPNSWTGEGSDRYRRKGMEMIQQVEISANNLNKIANTIRTVAERIYRAEMRALQIAERRDS